MITVDLLMMHLSKNKPKELKIHILILKINSPADQSGVFSTTLF
jgi:hypothetical protein